MQTLLLDMPALDLTYMRLALRECIKYGEHGIDIEEGPNGQPRCFNCGGQL